MNPELLRNVWLELTPRRMIQMAAVLALIFLAANATPSIVVADVAEYLFYAIVVLWGTRDAAQSVVAEIRDRTWDFQRLSALTPFEMTVGKLFGATSYVWFGGLICLAVMVASDIGNAPYQTWQTLLFCLAMGLLSHAVAMFASLIAVRRRQTRTRFNVFQYQAAGAIAGLSALQGWRTVDNNVPVLWWGWEVDAQAFYLLSLGAFLGWALIGCYRLMRLELQVENRPSVWFAFILFMAIYVAGFEDISFLLPALPFGDALSQRLALANVTLAFLTYVAVLFEPKDRVLYRWLGEMLVKGRTDLALSRLQCWMVAYAATMITGVVLTYQLSLAGVASQTLLSAPMVLAGMGFLTRDLGVFLYFGLAPEQKRGDMPAVISLAVLYLLLPMLLGAGTGTPSMLLYPVPAGGWAGTAIAWVEALAIWFVVATVRRKQMAPLQQN